MQKGKYIGRRRPLWHKTALLQPRGNMFVHAQFDDLSLQRVHTHNWRKYRRKDFIILEAF